MIEKIPISGGPHTGKTTLLGALQERFPDAYFVPEPATDVIASEYDFERRHDDYKPAVPWEDFARFAPLAIQRSMSLENEIPEDARIAFLDRSLIDNVAYARINNREHTVADIWQKVALAKYSFALMCEPVGRYAAIGVRKETEDEALVTHRELERAYDESGIEVVKLPPISVVGRVALITEVLQSRKLV